MADPRFYDSPGPLSLAQLEQLTGAKLLSGPSDKLIWDVAPLDRASPQHLSYCDGPKFTGGLKLTQACAVFVSKAQVSSVPQHVLALECTKPSLAFAQAAAALYPHAATLWPAQSPPILAIAPTARIGKDTIIAPGSFIGEGVEIGDACVISPGVVIGRGVQIGHDTTIGPQVSISHALVGDHCIIHAGSRIGQDGFGFVNGPAAHFKITQLGRVIVQDHVEIGANVTIDRGALSDTVIGEGTKIDNSVQIGHNTSIGRHCIIVSQVGISGSCEIDDFTVLGGQVGIADHVKIGKGTYIAAKAGVTRSLEGGRVYGGFPARPIDHWRREVGALSRLAKRSKAKHERDGNE